MVALTNVDNVLRAVTAISIAFVLGCSQASIGRMFYAGRAPTSQS